MSKVTQIRAEESARDVMPGAPNKVVGGDSMLAKLASTLERVMTERELNVRAVRSANAILREPAPPAFDNEAAGRSVAQARVDDLIKGTSTADAIAADFDKRREAAELAIAAYGRRQAEAQHQLDRANSFVAALTAQALEIDKALRKAFAGFGAERETSSADRLAGAIASYLDAYVEARATAWFAHVEQMGERGKQFSWPRERDVDLVVPEPCRDEIPAGWGVTAQTDVVRYDQYEIERRISARLTEMMRANTGGLYPEVGADLARAVDMQAKEPE